MSSCVCVQREFSRYGLPRAELPGLNFGSGGCDPGSSSADPFPLQEYITEQSSWGYLNLSEVNRWRIYQRGLWESPLGDCTSSDVQSGQWLINCWKTDLVTCLAAARKN